MKVKATYRHVFEVTREVEIDEDSLSNWASRKYGSEYDRELAAAAWLDLQDTEFHAEVFNDWRTNAPLPDDFELQYSDVLDVHLESP